MKVLAVSTSETKGVKKNNVTSAKLKCGHGLEGDAHAGDWHRQVSLLAIESIDKMRALGADVNPGDFAENITTEGLDVPALPIGARIGIGSTVELKLTQIGKECHTGCAIKQAVGTCIMPKEGVFFSVEKEGEIHTGDKVIILDS